jgi:putative transposase
MIVNSVADHVHMLIGYRPHQSLSDLMQDIKGSSSKWINTKGFSKSKFAWQEGYGAFSYSHSHIENVVNYIKDQENHHKKITFMDEYRSFLKAFDVEYDEKYLLKEPE